MASFFAKGSGIFAPPLAAYLLGVALNLPLYLAAAMMACGVLATAFLPFDTKGRALDTT